MIQLYVLLLVLVFFCSLSFSMSGGMAGCFLFP